MNESELMRNMMHLRAVMYSVSDDMKNYDNADNEIVSHSEELRGAADILTNWIRHIVDPAEGQA